ncbi:MAG: peptide-methionine (S)-S-oxide reductase [Candidatus Thiodiazotropha sp.]
MQQTIGFGGGCHWCTEAVFRALRGVQQVDQGFIRSSPPDDTWSEAVKVQFDPEVIGLVRLIDIHLHTHASTANHSMRTKYRSAIYVNSQQQAYEAEAILREMQDDFSAPLVTRVLPLVGFKSSDQARKGYFEKNKGNQFCERHIEPKLQMLRDEYPHFITFTDTTDATRRELPGR